MHTQVIVDNMKKIRLIRSEYMGHLNDAATFALLPVWALLSTREQTHKAVIFCKMNLKLEELC